MMVVYATNSSWSILQLENVYPLGKQLENLDHPSANTFVMMVFYVVWAYWQSAEVRRKKSSFQSSGYWNNSFEWFQVTKNQRLITSSLDITNAFNHHFSSMVDSGDLFTHFPNISKCSFSSFTLSALQMHIYNYNWKSSLSIGPHGISLFTLKCSGHVVTLLMLRFLNKNSEAICCIHKYR